MARAARAVALGVVAASVLVAAVGASDYTTVRVELRGFGQSLGMTPACPNGLTRVPIRRSHRYALHCVLSARKLTKPGLDPWRIIESVRVTTLLPRGTLRTRETQVFTFDEDSRSSASFRGRIIGGSGRFRGARGTVVGEGRGTHDSAIWRVTFRLW
jgi:hypothetical protein